MSARRGFTLIELSIVIAISSIVVPAVYLQWRALDAELAVAQWDLSNAERVRTLYEELARDARAAARCGPASYAVTGDRVLKRTSRPECGGVRALASGVEGFRWVKGGAEVELGLRLGPDRSRLRVLFVPVEGR